MPSAQRKSSAKRKTDDAVETSNSIAEQTAAFLKSGGSIEQVPSGVSGQTNLGGPKHITISKRR